MSDMNIGLEIVKHVGTAGVSFFGSFALINWRLKRLEKTDYDQEKSNLKIIEKIHSMKDDLKVHISEGNKRVHSRIDEFKDNINKEFTKIRAEYVSEKHCDSKMSSLSAK